jgi:hypothetical protein
LQIDDYKKLRTAQYPLKNTPDTHNSLRAVQLYPWWPKL